MSHIRSILEARLMRIETQLGRWRSTLNALQGCMEVHQEVIQEMLGESANTARELSYLKDDLRDSAPPNAGSTGTDESD